MNSFGRVMQVLTIMTVKGTLLFYATWTYGDTENFDDFSSAKITLAQSVKFFIFNIILIYNVSQLSSGGFKEHVVSLSQAQNKVFQAAKQQPILVEDPPTQIDLTKTMVVNLGKRTDSQFQFSQHEDQQIVARE